jgi:hypothetical protein
MIKKSINIGESTFILKFDEFEDSIDIDNLLKIDYSNLLGEMITYPTIVAKFGNMLAEAESQVNEKKLNLDVQEAKLKEEYKVKLMEQNGGKNPTIDALNTAVLLDKKYQVFKKSYISAQKTRDYLLTTYLAAKDKSEKINKVFFQANPSDIPDTVIEGKVNNTIIRKQNNKLIN